jgi:hypothetical protein
MSIEIIEFHFYGLKVKYHGDILDIDIDFREIPLYLSEANIRTNRLNPQEKHILLQEIKEYLMHYRGNGSYKESEVIIEYQNENGEIEQ